MKHSLALILLAACCTKPVAAPAGTVMVAGRTYPLVVVPTVEGRKSLRDLDRGDRGVLVLHDHARIQHYELPGAFVLLLLDDSDKVVEVVRQPEAKEMGVTTSVEARRGLFLPLAAAIKVGDRVSLPEIKVVGEPDSALRLGGEAVHVELARSWEERQHGLMYRTGMSKNDGMLFLYDSPDYKRFWMGNTYIDLDIAFFREDRTLINVVEMRKYPDPTVDTNDRAASKEPAKYVLEVNYGWFRSHGLIDADGNPLRKLAFEQVP